TGLEDESPVVPTIVLDRVDHRRGSVLDLDLIGPRLHHAQHATDLGRAHLTLLVRVPALLVGALEVGRVDPVLAAAAAAAARTPAVDQAYILGAQLCDLRHR